MGKDQGANTLDINNGNIRDFDRMKRLGYDSVKIHIPWKLDKDENPDFSGYPEWFRRIGRAGLDEREVKHIGVNEVTNVGNGTTIEIFVY